MSELVKQIDQVLEHPATKISLKDHGEISREDAFAIFQNKSKRIYAIMHISISLSDDIVKTFSKWLEIYLNEYVDPNNKQIVFCSNFSSRSLKIEEFSKYIAETAVYLGSAKVSKLIEDWKNGEPLCFQHKAHIVGISTENTINLSTDIKLESPQNPANELPVLSTKYDFGVDDFNKHYGSILTVNLKQSPCFIKYKTYNKYNNNYFGEKSLNFSGIKDFIIENFCHSMALSCNCYVALRSEWFDNGELIAFHLELGSSVIGKRQFVRKVKTVSDKDLSDVMSIYQRCFLEKHEVSGYNVALTRWIASLRDDRSFADKCIDLRIAIEALFLSDCSSELKFRLSLRAAWHLGKNFSDRVKIFDDFAEFYDLASKLVHAKDPMKIFSPSTSEADLQKIQNHVRNTLLFPQKLSSINWKNEILGRM